MVTLAQPKTWLCRQCERPIDVWMPLGMRLDLDGDAWANWSPPVPASLLCPEHHIDAAPEQRRQFLWNIYGAARVVRRQVDDPPGTLIFTEAILSRLGNPATTFPSWLYSVAVDEWDEALPQPTTSLDVDDRPTVLVTLAAVVTVESAVGPSLYFHWSWLHPELRASCELVGWDDPMTLPTAERLIAALGAFREFQTGRGRRKGSGNYSPDEFKEALDGKLAESERDGVTIVNTDMLADRMGLGRTQLFEMFNNAPGSRDRFRQHKRKAPR